MFNLFTFITFYDFYMHITLYFYVTFCNFYIFYIFYIFVSYKQLEHPLLFFSFFFHPHNIIRRILMTQSYLDTSPPLRPRKPPLLLHYFFFIFFLILSPLSPHFYLHLSFLSWHLSIFVLPLLD